MKQNARNVPLDLAAPLLYIAFAVYLYRPYFDGFERWQWLIPVNVCLAASGARVLSRRWVVGFTSALLAGGVYGFGPFMLGLAKFHPVAGLLAASVPWLFVPAVRLERKRGKWIGTPLLLLPFVVILLFFYVSALSPRYRVFPAPVQAGVEPVDLAGCVAPLVLAKRRAALFGLYHVPVAVFFLGLVMTSKARRYSLLLIPLAGLLLAFSRSFLDPAKVAWLGVSPVLWLSVTMTWSAVLCGIGLQGLLDAGYGDRKWILAAAILLGALAIVTLLLAAKYFQVTFGLADSYARLFVETAKMYLLGAIAAAIVFSMTLQKLRLHWLRWAILCTALAIDIFLGARYIVDGIL